MSDVQRGNNLPEHKAMQGYKQDSDLASLNRPQSKSALKRATLKVQHAEKAMQDHVNLQAQQEKEYREGINREVNSLKTIILEDTVILRNADSIGLSQNENGIIINDLVKAKRQYRELRPRKAKMCDKAHNYKASDTALKVYFNSAAYEANRNGAHTLSKACLCTSCQKRFS